MKRRELERQRKKRLRLVLAGVGAVALAVIVAVAALTPQGAYTQTDVPRVVISNTPMHIHPHLSITNQGVYYTVPASIGIQGGPYYDHSLDSYLLVGEGEVGKIAPLHTHAEDGIIHVEASVTRTFTLGEFFSIWGQPLGPNQTLSFKADAAHHLTMTVNGRPATLWGDLILVDGMQIAIAFN